MPTSVDHYRMCYNITVEHYQWLLDKQGGGCAICKTKVPDHKSGKFCVDHCHATNKIRGVLCSSCNTGLGKFRDSTKLLALAITYLQTNGLNKELVAANLPNPTRKKRGMKVGEYEKLHPDEVNALLFLRYHHRYGFSQVVLGRIFGLTQAGVSLYLRKYDRYGRRVK